MSGTQDTPSDFEAGVLTSAEIQTVVGVIQPDHYFKAATSVVQSGVVNTISLTLVEL